jgi:hypothetical protein
LRRAGYDDVVALELEDPFLVMDDTLEASVATLRTCLPSREPPRGNWFDNYGWEAAEIE